MANEFKIKHGFVSTGDGTVEGEIRVSGIAYAENGSRLATRAYLSQFLTDNNYVVTGDLPTNISAFTNDSGYLTEIIAHTHSAADITSGSFADARLPTSTARLTNFSNPVTISANTDGILNLRQMGLGGTAGVKEGGWNFIQFQDSEGDRQAYFGIDAQGNLEFNPEVSGAVIQMNRALVSSGTISASGGNSNNWNTAYGWGDHAGLYDTAGTGSAEAGAVNTRIDDEIIPLIDTKQDAGNYLTAESDTFATVTTRGNTSNGSIIVNGTVTASRGNFGSTGSNPQISIFTENASTSIADTFTDTTTDKSYIYFAAGTNSSDPGYIMHETSENSSPDERNEGVLHLVPSDDNTGTDYVSIHGTNDPDAVRIYTSGLIQTSSSYQLQIQSGSGSVRIVDDLSVQNTLYTDSHGNSSQWNTAYGWGNHGSVGYLTAVPSEYLTQTEGDARYDGIGAAQEVHDRIDNEVLPSIPTNNNELTNGAGYITDGNTGWNNTYGFITSSASITGNAATATKLATARNIALSGAVTGNANFDGSGNITIATTATSDPTLTLAGDASGSATFTNLGNATLSVTVANDSHTHDGRYYTESESDARFVNVTGDNLTGDLSVSGASLSVTSTADGSEAFFVDGVNGRLFTITDSLSDSLFSVNTISGLPVIEAFSDNTVKLGPFSNPVTIDAAGVLAIGGVTAATQTYVDTAVNNIIGGAPGALDTLNELAAAINDDASFASSVTSSLSLKAPLASPALTGTPTAPTQATSNNSTRIATTAFVKAQGYVTTDTNYYLNGISKSGNTLTFSVNGTTNRTYTFGSNAFTSYSNHVGLYDSAGTAASEAGAVNDRIDNEVLPLIQTPAITSNGSTPSLNTGITAAEIRSLIGAGTSSSDTNYYLSGATFNTGNGVLTLTVSGATDQTVDLDGRYAYSSHNHTSLNLTGSIYNGDANTSIDLKDHSDRTWLRNAVGGWTFQTGTSGDDWTQSYTFYLPAAGTTANAVWAEMGQRDSNDAAAGRYRGLRIVKDTGGIVDGDLRAGAIYIGTTRRDANWTAAFNWGNHAGLYDGIGSADEVNQRIDNEILPLIEVPAITSNGATPSLNSGITAAEVRSLIGAQASGSYLTSYSETDTLATVTSRGNTTSGSINVHGDILLTGSATTTNQGRMIDFTGFDKEGNTDYSDRAYIKHTTATGGHSGSVLVISSMNDSGDGIAFLTNASSKLKHNSNNIATENWVTSQSYLTTSGKAADSNLLDGINSTSFLRSDTADSFSGILTGTAAGENLKIGGIRGTAKGSQTGEYIHLYERVHIGGPNGWGASAHGAPSYGLSVWGSVNFGMNGSGVIQLDDTTIVNSSRELVNVTNANWDAAYSWGNHASAGYAVASTLGSLALEDSVTISEVTGLQTALDGKLSTTGKAADSNLLDGLDLHTGRNNQANKVVRTDGNGYLQAGWVNTTSGAAGTINKIYCSQDDYVRYLSPQNFRSQVTDGVYQPAGTYNTIIGTDSDINTSGATIIDNIYVTDGVITSMGTRTLTAANLGIAKPAPPAFGAANIVGETIEVVFEQSPTSGVDSYQVWSSVAGGSYGLIANIPTQDIAATMTAIDAAFSVSGEHLYRVYAIKNGIYSDPAEGGVTFNIGALDVVNMSVVNLNSAYYIQYDMPSSRFVDHIEIYMDAEASSGSLSRTGAKLVYSGNNTNYMYQIAAADMNKFHQFWVEVIES